MRVTDSAAFAAIRKQVTRARAEFATAQEQASSGLRVQKPSDDPVAAAAARREHGARRCGSRAGRCIRWPYTCARTRTAERVLDRECRKPSHDGDRGA